MPELPANIKIRNQEGICCVEFEDRKIIEELQISQIGERLGELVEDDSGAKLLLDFKNVEHMSSAALGMLITLNKQLIERSGRLVLANIDPQIYEIFKITRLNKLFNIQKTTEDAIKALS